MRRRSPGLNDFYNAGVLLPRWGISIGDGRFMTNDPYSTFATYSDPVNGQSYADREHMTNWGTSGNHQIRHILEH